MLHPGYMYTWHETWSTAVLGCAGTKLAGLK